ncbi:response regulator, partial [Myxococcota bacterium]|nr:response regulator [Myxococcota bacterium]MBU1533733.1 response regulator [Myxococcota bacterium]
RPQGAEFWFSLKLKKAGRTHPLQDFTTLHDLHVMVVESCETQRNILTRLFASQRMMCTAFSSAALALSWLDTLATGEERVDLLLMDSRGDAGDIAQVISLAQSLHPDVKPPAMAMPHVKGAFDWETYQQMGFSGILVKPLHPNDLLISLLNLRLKKFPLTAGFPERRKVPSTFPDSSCDNFRLLIVEDNRINQKVLQSVLETLNCHGDAVSNGEEALQILDLLPYDLVLMDMQMPVMDGVSAVRAIRNSKKRWSNIPVIALTANALDDDRERCLAAGMNDYLSKPVTLQKIQALIKKWGCEEGRQAPPVLSEKETEEERATLPLFDKEEYVKRVQNNEELAGIIARDYITETREAFNAMEAAMLAGDTLEAGQIAHKIRGTSANLACHQLAHWSKELELGVKNTSDLQTMLPNLPRIRETLTQTVSAIEKAFGL